MPEQEVDLTGFAFAGRVLDVGGGGEGIIARHTGETVVAIDIRRSELEEAPDTGLKIVMDACNMAFLNNTFDVATCFFTLMYMSEEEAGRCLAEVYRVLKPGGRLHIWDVVLEGEPAGGVFVIPLEVNTGRGGRVRAGYGTSLNHEYSAAWLGARLRAAGFEAAVPETAGPLAYACGVKPGV